MKPNDPCLTAAVGLAVLIAAWPTAAQPQPQGSERDRLMQAARTAFESVPAPRRGLLSGGAANMMQLLQFNRTRQGMGGAAAPASAAETPVIAAALPPLPGAGVTRVSNPRLDFTRSVTTGFTQSGTATAWCADSLVVGYNDSGSLLETMEAGEGLSFIGFSLSQDNGRTFLDLGSLPPDPNPDTLLGGNPSVVCTNADLFHFSSLFLAMTDTGLVSGVSVSHSTNGGAVWDRPVLAVGKDASQHMIDKDWVTADPAHPNNVFVTYSDFGAFGVDPSCATYPTTVELVRSTDAGATWSQPVVLESVCGFDAFVQGSQVTVGNAGEVFVVWERSMSTAIREIVFAKSTNGGASFSAPVVVSDVTCAGDCFHLQGGFRSGLEYPGLALDRSATAMRGNLYVAWADGRNLQVSDEASPMGFYGYADILLKRSTDGGASWSELITVNHDRPKMNTDQYQPAIAVDKRGAVAVCYYDRMPDPFNVNIFRSCSLTRDAGAHWTLRRIPTPFYAPIHGADTQVDPLYMGDYDGLASDTTFTTAGFVGGFVTVSRSGNQDVLANRTQ